MANNKMRTIHPDEILRSELEEWNLSVNLLAQARAPACSRRLNIDMGIMARNIAGYELLKSAV